MEVEHVDVLIVGAGLSGIGAAAHLRKSCPDRSFAILEGRERLGGTWDLFRYPGIRSDSDMYTLGYAFRPWTEPKAIADGPSILRYIEDTARDEGVDGRIRYGHRVTRAAWSTPRARWEVTAEADGRPVRFTCSFLFLCGGYYRYDRAYAPDLPGRDGFRGVVVHPQFWPDELNWAGKRVVVIGSGATAVTLVPEMARTAAQVVMLQRSPSYVVARPSEDRLALWCRRWMPERWAYQLTRWRKVLLGLWFYRLVRRRPAQAKRTLVRMAAAELPEGFDVATHFTPRYNPWDQRVCLAPDGDLFKAIGEGRAEVVTGDVEAFTEGGLRLKDGRELAAEIVVTATGLELQVMNGVELSVDGRQINPAELLSYKGMMYDGVPNLASAFGYTNASWTLKCDLTCEYVCRLLNHMRAAGFVQCTPVNSDPEAPRRPWIDFTSGYVVRAIDRFPKQGDRAPWRLHQNYLLDLLTLRYSKLEDGVMIFSKPTGATLANLGHPPV